MRFGQWKTNSILREKIDRNAKYIWFHASSLGEFEQGRPMIEKIKAEHPEYKVLLTFFSPSGYEVRKNYKGADVICYLPFRYAFPGEEVPESGEPGDRHIYQVRVLGELFA